MTLLPDLIQQLKSSLLASASAFIDDDFQRHIKVALADFSRRRPLVCIGVLSLSVGVSTYTCPPDLSSVLGFDWGRDSKLLLTPWDDRWPGRLPEIRIGMSGTERVLLLMPAPTQRQIDLLGASGQYRYGAMHQLDNNISTVLETDIPLVLLRAQAEALRELAMKHTTTPFQVRDGISATPRNGTPAYLHKVLLEEFERRICL